VDAAHGAERPEHRRGDRRTHRLDNLRTATAPASADLELQEGCGSYDSDVAVDAATGEAVDAWFSNVDAQYGILVRPVHPALGAIAYAPGSARADREAAISPDQRTPITSRLGAPGIYLAYCIGYPSCTRIVLWRYGAGGTMIAARPGGDDVTSPRVPTGACR